MQVIREYALKEQEIAFCDKDSVALEGKRVLEGAVSRRNLAWLGAGRPVHGVTTALLAGALLAGCSSSHGPRDSQTAPDASGPRDAATHDALPDAPLRADGPRRDQLTDRGAVSDTTSDSYAYPVRTRVVWCGLPERGDQRDVLIVAFVG